DPGREWRRDVRVLGLRMGGWAVKSSPNTPDALPAPLDPVRVTLRRKGVPAPLAVTLPGERFHPETGLGVARREDNTWEDLVDRRRRIPHLRLATLSN